MRDVFGPGTILGYCTNVHAGQTLDEIKSNLQTHALEVKRIVSPNEAMGIGLWLPHSALCMLLLETTDRVHAFWSWLREIGVLPFTFNGFPVGDFHEESVKYNVYEPSWLDNKRGAHTLGLAVILSDLLPPGSEGSISTLPIGWAGDMPKKLESVESLRWNLLTIVLVNLDRIKQSSGRLIHVDFEPEPGCVLQRSSDVVKIFWGLFDSLATNEEFSVSDVRRYFRVCHDICHAAVMFEDQAEVIDTYRKADVRVGKIQISNAIRVPFDEYSESEKREALQQLAQFAEDRYLHQTMIRMPDGELRFFDDLPDAIQSVPSSATARGEWRTHFHVPIYLERFGLLQTTRHEILECLRSLRPEDEVHHFEVETYAWNVLPPELQVETLADGIARELQWVKDHAAGIIAP